MKTMGWDDQMKGPQTIDQVHILSGDGWRGWDGDDQMRGRQTIDQVHVLPKDDEEDRSHYQMRGLLTIDKVHVLPVDR